MPTGLPVQPVPVYGEAEVMTPEVCPNCEAEVPAGARACPECGADESTGWSPGAQHAMLLNSSQAFER